MEDDESSLLLGVRDIDMTPQEDATCGWATNKFGGTPNWLVTPTPGHEILCRVCGGPLSHVLQICAPLEHIPHNRVLYVWACPQPACFNKNEGWLALRCQSGGSSGSNSTAKTQNKSVKDNTEPISTQTHSKTSPNAPKALQNPPNPPTSTKLFESDWGVEGGDEWGEDGGDDGGWGAEEGSKKETTGGLKDDDFDRLLQARDESLLRQNEDDILPPPPYTKTAATNAECSTPPPYMPPTQAADPVSSLSESLENLNLGGSNTTSGACSRGNQVVFQAAYMNAEYEPEGVAIETHVHRLLKDYEKTQGAVTSGADEDEVWEGETYEKADYRHNDKAMKQYLKRIERYPAQCLRYEFGGQPLHAIANPPSPPPCPNCGASRVFELQVLPYLWYTLRPNDSKTVTSLGSVDWATVMVYTCRAGCWKAGDWCRHEHVIVQLDPDAHVLQERLSARKK